jgi:Ca-activated chloride channel family protein
MKLDNNNYRLTAYVLDELSPREKARVEKAIQSDPELQTEIDEIRRATALMDEVASLEAASSLSLDEDGQAAIEDAIAALEEAECPVPEREEPAPLPWWIRILPPQQWAPLGTAVLVVGIGFIAFKDITVFRGSVPQDSFISSDEGISVSIEEASPVISEMGDFEMLPEVAEEIEISGDSSAQLFGKTVISEPEPGNEVAGREDRSRSFVRDEIAATGSTSSRMKPLTTRIPQERIEGTPMPIKLPQRTPSSAPQSQEVASANTSLTESDAFKQRAEKVSKPKDSDVRYLESAKSGLALSGYVETQTGYGLAGGNIGLSKKETERRTRASRGPSDEKYSRLYFPGGEDYAAIEELGFTRIKDAESATSTFSADVDTASYSNIRRFLNQGQLPPADAVRIEELVNYFTYDYEEPAGKHPFAAEVEMASCPWQPKHRLARIGIRAASLDADERPPMNLVFLIDVSGSMRPANKLPLLKRAMKTLVKNLNEEDRVAMVTYAGSSGLVLDSTPVSDRQSILEALDRLNSGGSTAGASGIKLAYEVAREHFDDDAMNRVILCTDGDFNVGTTNNDELLSLIRKRSNEGIFLNIYGFGMGNIKDDRLEKLSNEGNGTYGYIDNYQEAQKVFGEQLEGTLATVAKDVKFQLEFNPQAVAAYRLIGYENRILAREDFNDDTKDAGEVGAGHTVTALYEIVPVGVEGTVADVDPHRYIEEGESGTKKTSLWERLIGGKEEELFFLKIRYKQPDEDSSQLMTFPVKDNDRNYTKASDDFRFAAAVAGFGQLLRGSRYSGELEWDHILEMARGSRGEDNHGHRAEFIRLAETAAELQGE